MIRCLVREDLIDVSQVASGCTCEANDVIIQSDLDWNKRCGVRIAFGFGSKSVLISRLKAHLLIEKARKGPSLSYKKYSISVAQETSYSSTSLQSTDPQLISVCCFTTNTLCRSEYYQPPQQGTINRGTPPFATRSSLSPQPTQIRQPSSSHRTISSRACSTNPKNMGSISVLRAKQEDASGTINCIQRRRCMACLRPKWPNS